MKEREEALLDDFLGGSEPAFEELVKANREKLYRTVMRIVRNHDDALDVMQESLVKAFRSAASFRRESSFSTWLTSIAIRGAINRAKRDRFRNMLSLSLLTARPSDQGDDPENKAELSLLEKKVDEALKSLPPIQRAVFSMKFYEGFTTREIAKIMGSSEGAAKANYFHAVRKLRQSLSGLKTNE